MADRWKCRALGHPLTTKRRAMQAAWVRLSKSCAGRAGKQRPIFADSGAVSLADSLAAASAAAPSGQMPRAIWPCRVDLRQPLDELARLFVHPRRIGGL